VRNEGGRQAPDASNASRKGAMYKEPPKSLRSLQRGAFA